MNGFFIGNGQSRAPIDLIKLRPHGKIIGCNALYRDFTPDLLCAVDHGIMHEIYHSGYCNENEAWFRNWSKLPAMAFENTVYNMNPEVKKEVDKYFDNIMINERNDSQYFVFHGSSISGKAAIISRYKGNPEIIKREINNMACYVSWIKEGDKSNDLTDLIPAIRRDRGWACGATAGLVGLKRFKDIDTAYLIGHDLYSVNQQINNMYKGSKYYGVPEAPATPCVNWISQWNHLMAEFPKVKFIKVNPKGIKGHGDDQVNNEIYEWSKNKNISYMSFREFDDRFKLGLTNID